MLAKSFLPNYKIKNMITPYLMIFPSLIIYVTFVFVPILMTFQLSFTNYDFYKTKDFTGIANYLRLLQDPVFLISFKNTMVYAFFTIIPQLALGLIFAVLLNQKLIGQKFHRVSLYMPHVTSMVSISMVFLWIYNPANGFLNMVMNLLGLSPQKWLFDTRLALFCMILMGIWKMVGYIMIIYLAGLQQIPSHLYEAAIMDGATGTQKFYNITIPMLRPTTFFLFIISCVDSFMVFEQVMVMTQGGPLNSTTTVVHQIFERAFMQYQMGYASAMAMFMIIIVLIITVLNFKFGNQGKDMDIS